MIRVGILREDRSDWVALKGADEGQIFGENTVIKSIRATREK